MRPLLAKQLGNKREADVLSSDCQSVDLFIHRLRSLTVRLIKYWPESDHMYFSVFLSPRSDRVWRLIHFTGGLRGASIIDSLDTLYIMGLMEEYNDAKEWVKNSLDLNSVSEPTNLWATPHDLDFVVCLMWFLNRSESCCVFSCQRTFVQTFYSPVHGVQVRNNVVTFDVRKFCFHQLSPWVSLSKKCVCSAPLKKHSVLLRQSPLNSICTKWFIVKIICISTTSSNNFMSLRGGSTPTLGTTDALALRCDFKNPTLVSAVQCGCQHRWTFDSVQTTRSQKWFKFCPWLVD